MDSATHKNCGGEILTRQEVVEYGIPLFEDGKIMITENESTSKMESLVLDEVIDTDIKTECEPYCDNCCKIVGFNEIIWRNKDE